MVGVRPAKQGLDSAAVKRELKSKEPNFMKFNWRNILVVAGLGVGAGLVAPSCVIRAQVKPAYVVDTAPPAPQYETRPARAGHLWVKGSWEWRANRWQWKRGRYVALRSGRSWQAGRWEQRGNRWHWVQGRWVASGTVNVHDHRTPAPAPGPRVHDHRTPAPAPAPGPRVHDSRTPKPTVTVAYPTSAPPAPQYQVPAARAGYVWIRGHYTWKNGAYKWNRGHWEGQKAGNAAWVQGHWRANGNRWTWTPGHWTKTGPTVKVKRR